jgi:hypothetical protein
VPVYSAGPHRLLVRDPETDEDVAVQFKVAPVTVERQKAERNVKLQADLANATGGKAYELYELAKLPADLNKPSVEVTTERRFELWSTWLVLGLVLVLMLGEWFVRKLMNMK